MATFIKLNELFEDPTESTDNSKPKDPSLQDPSFQCAGFVKPLIEEQQGNEAAVEFENKFTLLYNAQMHRHLFDLLLDTSEVVFNYVNQSEDHKSKRESEADGYFMVLLSMLTSIDDNEDDEEDVIEIHAVRLCEFLSANNDLGALKLKVMMVLYNMFKPLYHLRYTVFDFIVKYAFATKQFDKIMPYLADLDAWLEDWELEVEDERNLFFNLSWMMRELKHEQKAYQYLKRFNSLFQGASEAEISEEKTVTAAFQLVRDCITLPNVLQVDSILGMDSVKYLAQSKKEHQSMIELLKIIQAGTLEQFEDFHQRSKAFFEQWDISFEVTHCKMRLLTLASLCQGCSELPLEAIASGIKVDESEVETWVVRALAEGVVDGRIDQVKRVVLVKSALQREFMQAQWEFLGSRVDCWIENLQSLMKTIVAAKETIPTA